MTEKYIDLAPAINEDVDSTNIDIRFGIQWTLEYLDAHPGQAPGRTITVGEFERAWADSVDQDDRKQYRDFLALLGITVVPDPEPTNAELLVEDLAGIYGANLTWTAKIAISEALAERGWVKAPGGD